eukprot:gb/GEZN01014550.1/.p1 GENE.gb/GEZN01014550.1/~~gb/GEZN01014550.1/.p1  ORF type:complete len:242 (-),score=40.05 gb/GEZN01014550.1/:220-861(-)
MPKSRADDLSVALGQAIKAKDSALATVEEQARGLKDRDAQIAKLAIKNRQLKEKIGEYKEVLTYCKTKLRKENQDLIVSAKKDKERILQLERMLRNHEASPHFLETGFEPSPVGSESTAISHSTKAELYSLPSSVALSPPDSPSSCRGGRKYYSSPKKTHSFASDKDDFYSGLSSRSNRCRNCPLPPHSKPEENLQPATRNFLAALQCLGQSR